MSTGANITDLNYLMRSTGLAENSFLELERYGLEGFDVAVTRRIYTAELASYYKDFGMRLNPYLEVNLLSVPPFFGESPIVRASSLLCRYIRLSKTYDRDEIFAGKWWEKRKSMNPHINLINGLYSPTSEDYLTVLERNNRNIELSGNQLLHEFIKSMLLGGSEGNCYQFYCDNSSSVTSSCDQTEILFDRIRKNFNSGTITIFLDKNGEPILLEKTSFSEGNKLAMNLTSIVVNGVLFPAGSIFDTRMSSPANEVITISRKSTEFSPRCYIQDINKITNLYPLKISLAAFNEPYPNYSDPMFYDKNILFAYPNAGQFYNFAVELLQGNISNMELFEIEQSKLEKGTSETLSSRGHDYSSLQKRLSPGF